MKKTLSDPIEAAEIIDRFKKLQPNSVRLWGTMLLTEMLLHCTLANRFIFEDNSPYRKPTVAERLRKFACFHIISQLPKNRVGPARLQTFNKAGEDQFEEQRKALIISIEKFATHEGPINCLHAALGFLTPIQWGIISWMHMDHHLRQFGA